jgi:hypothetical protein
VKELFLCFSCVISQASNPKQFRSGTGKPLRTYPLSLHLSKDICQNYYFLGNIRIQALVLVFIILLRFSCHFHTNPVIKREDIKQDISQRKQQHPLLIEQLRVSMLVIVWTYYLCDKNCENNLLNLQRSQCLSYTAGISLYKDNLYVNLYMMPIFDLWNCV